MAYPESSGRRAGPYDDPADVGIRVRWRELAPTPHSIGDARRALDCVREELGGELHGIAVLLVSELVTNSLQHADPGGSGIDLIVCLTEGVLRVTVSDGGEGFSTPPVPHGDAYDGRGLHLVQELADRWGHRVAIRACVWFEVDRPRVAERVSMTLSPPTQISSRRRLAATR